jgi:hypothetical protein
MPRLDHTVPVGKRLSTNERALLRLMQALVNAVRDHAGLELLTEQAVSQQLRQLLREEDAVARAPAQPGGDT